VKDEDSVWRGGGVSLSQIPEVAMAGSIKPIVKGIYVCDDVVGNPVGGKPMIVNLWNTFRPPAGSAFPYMLKKLCVFA
jgi:hypothetical protein